MAGIEDRVLAGCDDVSTHHSHIRSILREIAARRFGPPEVIAPLCQEIAHHLNAAKAANIRTREARSSAPRGRAATKTGAEE